VYEVLLKAMITRAIEIPCQSTANKKNIVLDADFVNLRHPHRRRGGCNLFQDLMLQCGNTNNGRTARCLISVFQSILSLSIFFKYNGT